MIERFIRKVNVAPSRGSYGKNLRVIEKYI